MRIGNVSFGLLDLLLVFVPVATVAEIMHAEPVWIFVFSCIGIIPLAGWMGKSTEHLAAHYGPGIGGLLNASFGNAAELIIALLALQRGLHDVVKASITGSIIGNVLLVLGLAMFLGGVKHRRQQFNPTAAGMGSTLLALSAIGLLVPAIFHFVAKEVGGGTVRALSLDIAIVLFGAYVLSLIFQLKTHSHLFADPHADGHGSEALADDMWSKTKALVLLVVSTALVALMAEFLVGSVQHTAESWGMTEVFVGVILVAIVGNAAEHSTAVIVAMKGKMDLAVNIAVGSGIQIALFVAPLLVFVSYGLGPGPMNLEFTLFEVIAVTMAVSIVVIVANDGESHWMEGILLLAVYVILGIAFFFLPVPA